MEKKRKQAEVQRESALEELRLRESYLSAIIENMPGLLWMKDRKGKFLAVNTEFAVSCGLNRPGLLIGKTDFDIWPPELAAGYVADDERVMRSGKPFMVEEPISVTGDLRWFETFKTPIRDTHGTIIGTTGYSRDITERKKAADALLASELKYRELANTVPTGIFECEPDGKLIFANTILFKWFGYTDADARAGINVIDFIDAQDRGRAKKNMVRASDPPSFRPNEYCAVRKDGSTMQVLIISRQRIVNGQAAGLRGILLDLTEKKNMEAAIQNATRLESLGVLAGGIAHDFNNLLGGIFGYLSLANVCVAGGKFENVPEYLTKALDVFERARALTQQLLTFSKGGAPILKTLRLAPLLKKWAQFALSGSSIVCRCAIADDLCLCDCDENQIGQVIDNIVINAKQAMPMGGEIILTAQNVSVKQDPGGNPARTGDFVKISITDLGIGMPKEILPRIFDPFFSTKETGHGLGLTTCYSIISRHGGYIDVESEPGKGSAFHVFLPVSRNPHPSSSEDKPILHKGSGAFLIMDDEEMIRKPIGDVLKLWGYTVASMETGRQAIDFLTSEIKAGRKLAGMILDLTVPGGMGGKEAIKEIRKLSAETPVFVASGYADDPVMANPRDYGFTASICKPFTVNELAGMLNEHLKT